MINIGGGPAFILGVAMILAGVALYALRSLRPELSRDHDIFFAAIALTTGAILMWQGWRLDPFLFLGYLCAAGSAAFFGVENIRLRGITTEQAKRSTPIADKGRSVSRRYDYEPQDYDYDQDYDDYRPERRLPSREDRAGRRIRATRDSRNPYVDDRRRLRRRDEYEGEPYAGARYPGEPQPDDRYADERYAPVEREPLEDAPRKRRLPRSSRSVERPAASDDWDAPEVPMGDRSPARLNDLDEMGQRPSRSRPSDGRRRPLNVKPAPAGYGGASYGDEPPASSSEYADYRPIGSDLDDDEADNRDYQQPY